jgi:hypothetical protein
LTLLRVGFALPSLLPVTRCALTAPFHPYLHEWRRYVFCGTFRRVAPPSRYEAHCPLEFGLSSALKKGLRLPVRLRQALYYRWILVEKLTTKYTKYTKYTNHTKAKFRVVRVFRGSGFWRHCRLFGFRGFRLCFDQAQDLPEFAVKLLGNFLVFAQELLGDFPALPKALAFIGEPGPALFDQLALHG